MRAEAISGDRMFHGTDVPVPGEPPQPMVQGSGFVGLGSDAEIGASQAEGPVGDPAGARPVREPRGMRQTTRSPARIRAERRFAAIEKRQERVRAEQEETALAVDRNTARLRELRLAKEAEDKADAQVKAAARKRRGP